MTETIDAAGLDEETTRIVRLELPAGLQSTRDSVSVRLKIEPTVGEILVAVAPRVTEVGDGLLATLETTAVTLTLRGELPTLRDLAPDALRVTVDASELTAGRHVLAPSIKAPDGVEVVGKSPEKVVVVLTNE